MKLFLALLIFATACHAAIIPDAELANLKHYIEVMQDAAKHSKEQADDAIARADVAEESSKLALTTLASEREKETAIQAAHIETLKANAKVQSDFDKAQAEIAKQAASLARWQTFGRAVLLCVFAVTFAFAWRLLGPLLPPTPYTIYLRIAASVIAGASVSGTLWYVITRLL
jgi:hypothetical protein